MKFLACVVVAAATCLPLTNAVALQTPDSEYEAVAEEFIKGYFAARPLLGTAMGLHEYDGKISDYSRLALDAELSRLRRFEDRLAKFDPAKLGARQSIDLRILQAAVKKDLFEMQDMSVFERNPMVYAGAADVNVYIKRNFAPLEDRVRSLVAIESQIPNILIAAKTNLNDVLPKPYVELAIQIARGSADFLKKDLVAAVSGLKDEQLRAAFLDANRQGPRQNPQVRFEPSFGRDPFGRSREGERDPGIPARHVVCLDGYARPVRETRHRRLLLRHACRERLAGETKGGMADRFQLLHLRHYLDS